MSRMGGGGGGGGGLEGILDSRQNIHCSPRKGVNRTCMCNP